MDQQYWDSEEMDDDLDAETQAGESDPEIFYQALKLALARLKEFSAASPG